MGNNTSDYKKSPPTRPPEHDTDNQTGRKRPQPPTPIPPIKVPPVIRPKPLPNPRASKTIAIAVASFIILKTGLPITVGVLSGFIDNVFFVALAVCNAPVARYMDPSNDQDNDMDMC